MPDAHTQPFDRRSVRRHRDRAAVTPTGSDVIRRHVVDGLIERLRDIPRVFPRVLDLGGFDGLVARRYQDGAIAGIGQELLVTADLSRVALTRAPGNAIVADDERLPIADASLDLVVSALSLHWVNDLPGALIQIRRALRPDGLFLAALLGGETLHALRQAFVVAEIEVCGGARPRFSPMIDIRDAGALLQRAGFSLPVADLERMTVAYETVGDLFLDLRRLGETNALTLRPRDGLRRAVLARACDLFKQATQRADGKVVAQFDVIYMIGWAPAASQPKPKRPGSATVSLKDVLERPGGTGALS